MAAGEIENIKSPAGDVFIQGFGWLMPTGTVETISADLVGDETLRQSEIELESLISTSAIEVRFDDGTVVQPGQVLLWIGSLPPEAIAPGRPMVTYFGTLPSRIPAGSGQQFLAHNSIVTHTQSPIVVAVDSLIKGVYWAGNTGDPDRTYDLELMLDPVGTPTFERVLVTTVLSQATADAINLPGSLLAGNYGIRMNRASGTGRSQFTRGILQLVLEN